MEILKGWTIAELKQKLKEVNRFCPHTNYDEATLRAEVHKWAKDEVKKNHDWLLDLDLFAD